MYRDNTLIPAEATRLAALGHLAARPCGYGELAHEVRAFTAHIAGPSLDLLGSSLELLRYEGLIEPDGDERLRLTDAGRAALLDLLCANVRSPVDAVSKLILALKLRFLHFLPPREQLTQIAQMIEACALERARLVELARRHAGEKGLLVAFLDHDLAQLDARIAWLKGLVIQAN